MTIEIKDLTFKCIIGLLDFERTNEQRVIVNLKLNYVYKKDNYINYVTICEIIKKTLIDEKFELLEDALLCVKENIFKEYQEIEHLELKISKPDILKDCIVSLSDSWSK